MNLKTAKYFGASLLVTLFSAGSALAQSSTPDFTTTTTVPQPSPIVSLVELLIFAIVVAGMWKVFIKAGQPGWAAVIPIYNVIILLKVAGKPLWWIILLIIPLVNIIIGVLVGLAVAKNFGKGAGFGIGLIFLPFIFYPILGFGDATYQGSAAPAPIA
ncbi:MAG TPA: DUF5684 domain-containing protein [Chthoniobacteraceae bacterium]|nr:DUF5684 domain-containing protein [Chthoniobacteraceae bacterium]